MRIPRKLKKKIPKGPYCYTFTGKTSTKYVEEYDCEVPVYHTIVCPFYEHKEGLFGHCKLIKDEIIDQCKSCGLKDN